MQRFFPPVSNIFGEYNVNLFGGIKKSPKYETANIRDSFEVSYTIRSGHTPLAGADPEYLERGFICIKLWGLALLILSQFS